MKVLHVISKCCAGAGKAVLRLHNEMLEQGISSKVLCSAVDKGNCFPEVYVYSDKRNKYYKNLKLAFQLTPEQRNNRLIKNKPRSYATYTFPRTSFDLSNHSLVLEADIIHLHWVAGFLDYPSFFKKVKKPIVWTLHDKNPCLGGFHYELDYINNERAFRDLECRLRKIKVNSIQNLDALRIICPSDSLADFSRKSEIFNKFKHMVIPNGLDFSIFKQRDKKFCRELLGIGADEKVLLFASESKNKWKGFEVLQESLNAEKNEYYCLVIGGRPSCKPNLKAHYLGYVKDEILMSCIYSAADVLINPSYEESFSFITLESIACGTPVISTKVGAVPDMLQDNNTGLFFEIGNSDDLATQIEKFFKFSKEKLGKMKKPA